MTKRLTHEFVKSGFEKEKFILLTENYKNSNQKLNYICSAGHAHSIRWKDWQRGFRCPYCSGKAKKTIGFIREEFKNGGYTLLSRKYINVHNKLNYACPLNHKHSITWAAWNQGKRCPTCKVIRLSGENSPHWKGGISCKPYCDAWADKEYKESIKERDGNKCLNPTCGGMSSRLSVHHIDYNKKNCEPKNLITLCPSCNSRGNIDRKWHTAWYQAIMNNRYGYIY